MNKCKTFLEKLDTFGTTNNYFEKKEISKINKTCCSNSKTEVIDFDKTKEIISKEKDLKQPKSCDALKILHSCKRIDFIEFKGFKKFIQYNNKKSFSEKLDKQIEKFDFLGKIQESLYILNTIILSNKFSATNDEKRLFKKIEKNYIILVDIDLKNNPQHHLATTLLFLSQTSSKPKFLQKNFLSDDKEYLISEKLSNSISESKMTSEIDNLKSPMLQSCKDIDSYYKNFS